MQYMILILISL